MKKIILLIAVLSLSLSYGQKNSEVMLKLFNMETNNDFVIDIPEIKAKCKLTEFVKLDDIEYAKGAYSNEDEIGQVYLDYLKINTINLADSKTKFYFIAPFIVSNQGSGSFNYLGFFVQDSKKMNIKHLNSYFLGDRIILEEIKVNNNNILVQLKDHGEEQAMSEVPNKSKTLNLIVNKKGFIK